MSYSAGNSGHMQAHADLVIAVNVELARFGLPDDLPIKSTGDEGHLDDHNAIVAALTNIESTSGQTFSTALPPTRNLGDPGHPADHSALEACVAEAATWPAWNDATGGYDEYTVNNYNGTGEKWRVIEFLSSGTLDVVKAAQPFRVLVVGGGGGGASGHHADGMAQPYGGSGGAVENQSVALSVGGNTVTVGGGGGPGAQWQGQGGTGGTSSLGPVSAYGGTGATGLPRIPGVAGGPQIQSTITGTNVTYAGNGIGTGGLTYVTDRHGDPGLAGLVIVSYRIG